MNNKRLAAALLIFGITTKVGEAASIVKTGLAQAAANPDMMGQMALAQVENRRVGRKCRGSSPKCFKKCHKWSCSRSCSRPKDMDADDYHQAQVAGLYDVGYFSEDGVPGGSCSPKRRHCCWKKKSCCPRKCSFSPKRHCHRRKRSCCPKKKHCRRKRSCSSHSKKRFCKKRRNSCCPKRKCHGSRSGSRSSHCSWDSC